MYIARKYGGISRLCRTMIQDFADALDCNAMRFCRCSGLQCHEVLQML